MGTLMIEQEYWTVQYMTSVIGCGMIFWPEDGQGRFGTETDAADYANTILDRNSSYPSVRVVHVIKRERFGQPLTRVLDASKTDRID